MQASPKESEKALKESKDKEGYEGRPQPLSQLITAFSRSATTEQSSTLEADVLYISYADIMSQVIFRCH